MTKLALLVLLVGATAGCNHDVLGAGKPSDPATEMFAASLAVDIPSFSRKESGVYYRDVRIGTGEEAAAADQVTITYAAYLKDGTLFDSQSSPTQVLLATRLPGFRDGVIGMRVGGLRKIVVPSALAYSWQGVLDANPRVPRNATVIFDVELFAVTKPTTTSQ